VAREALSYVDACRWLAAHPTEGASMRKLKRQALLLDPDCLPVMVEILGHGSADEVRGAFNVLYHHGARFAREGDSPARCRSLVTPDNLSAEDFEEEEPSA
jgi:hypothetical protein